jgi:plasmid stabilization system protein ParE
MERGQDRRQENPALTHYDDLGVSANASGDEIREAYLNLVRLLHPDMLREPSLKRFAETQMQRIGRAYAVLSDPERRRRYDAELATGVLEPGAPPKLKRGTGRSRARALITLGWLICAFAGIVGIGWYVSQQTGGPSEPVQVSAAPIPLTPAAPPSSAAAPGLNDKAAELESLRAELAAAKADGDRTLEQTILQAKELDFLTSRILAAPSRPAAAGFTGVWVLPTPKVAPAASAFTPEAVDLILSEQPDKIQGRYRARYPGMGAAEPPMVRFYFDGECQGYVATAVWSGDGGSRGEIQLKLTSGNGLQLVWSTTQPGRESGPDSGTVALVRK